MDSSTTTKKIEFRLFLYLQPGWSQPEVLRLLCPAEGLWSNAYDPTLPGSGLPSLCKSVHSRKRESQPDMSNTLFFSRLAHWYKMITSTRDERIRKCNPQSFLERLALLLTFQWSQSIRGLISQSAWHHTKRQKGFSVAKLYHYPV